MQKTTYPLVYYGDLKMPWSKGTKVENARGFIWLAGTEGRDPNSTAPRTIEFEDGSYVAEVEEGAEAQALVCLNRIKDGLEEMGSSLEHIVKMTTYVVGPFPDGVAASPTWKSAFRIKERFFEKHCPELCSDRSPPPHDLIGVAALASKRMLLEMVVVAAVP